jgi:hypothetical protein
VTCSLIAPNTSYASTISVEEEEEDDDDDDDDVDDCYIHPCRPRLPRHHYLHLEVFLQPPTTSNVAPVVTIINININNNSIINNNNNSF